MRQVFISYSSRDEARANEIVDALEAKGIECWIAPRDIRVGSNYTRDIPKAIRECRYFLVLLSPDALNSRWVQRETTHAISSEKSIIPLIIEDAARPAAWEFLLHNVQAVNYAEDPEGALQQIVSRIKGAEPQAPALKAAPAAEKPTVRHVFISHSTTDDAVATKIVAHLEKQNIVCWMAPRDTRSHTTFPAQITQAVRECPIFLLLVSKLSMDSSHVEREISLAIDKKISPGYKYIIPLMLEDCELTDEFCYYLANLHYYAYHKDPENILDKVTEQILQFIRKEEASVDTYLKDAQERYTAGLYKEAVQYYHKAARLGNADAQAMLGYCYHTGKHGTRSLEEAIKWYTMAANQGNANAQANLALCYAYENSIPRDWEKAVSLFRKAAEQGHAGAQRHLGTCYENGTGVAKNLSTARKWYQMAADQGDADAIKKLEALQ